MTSTTVPHLPTGPPHDPPPRIRPLKPGEVDTLNRVFGGLSARSVYLRFHTGMPHLAPSAATRLAAVVPGVHEVFVAEQGGAPLGVSRWVRYPGTEGAAELAVEVVDAEQGHGVGRHLVRSAALAAAAAGIREVLVHVHPENDRVRDWVRRAGGVPDAEEPDHYRLPLPASRASRACGCMSPCRSGCSVHCASGTTATRRLPGGSAPGRCSPSCSPVAGAPCPRTSSSTSSGARTPAA